MSLFRLLSVLISGGLALACASSSAPAPAKQDVLAHLADEVIVPRYQAAAETLNQLQAALRVLCAQANLTHLASARSAWRDAREAWMRVQAMTFGPATARRSRSLVAWHPIDPERIERALQTREAVTPEDVREYFAATQRGLGTIEYLIFQDDGAVLSHAGSAEAVHCPYLTSVGDAAAQEMQAVLAQWTGAEPGAAAYADAFKGSAPSSLLDDAAIAEAVRTMVFLSRALIDMQLGAALGVADGMPDPAALPIGLGRHAVADMRNQVLGMQDLYLGASDSSSEDEALGLSALIRPLSAEADAGLRAGFRDALTALAALAEPAPDVLWEDPQPAENAYAHLKTLQRGLNTDVVSLLGVSVGFADTDGDSG